ncbi:MAG: ABC transporter substrate-binding protein [Oligoflexales bacterium]|nr:ABC transporter substrate-binding protein [Oligoflexales bacterium]
MERGSRFSLGRLLFIFATVLTLGAGTANAQKVLRILMLDSDVPGLTILGNTFDPQSLTVINKIMDTLVTFSDEERKLVPHLATSWRIVPSDEVFSGKDDMIQKYKSKIWEFTLRKGVKFHNGEDFNADAVVYNFERILDPKTVGTPKQSGVYFMFGGIEKVEKVDDYKVRFLLKAPDGMFLNRFIMNSAINAPKEFETKGLDEFQKHPVGTGPFMFESYEKGKEIVLKKNPDYWISGLPKVDKLVFKIINPDDWIKEVQNGSVDLAVSLPGKKIESNLKGMLDSGKLKYDTCADARNYYRIYLSNEGALKNAKVRQALNYALDKKHMLNFLEKGIGNIMATSSFPGETGYNKNLKPYPFDIKKAKALLKEAEKELGKEGIDISKGITLKFAIYPTGVPLFNYLKFQLKKINVELEADTMPFSQWKDEINKYKAVNGKPNPKYQGAIHFVPSPINHYGFTAGTQFFSKAPSSLSNLEEVDQKYLDAMAEAEPAKHQKKMEALDEAIYRLSAGIFSYNKALTLVYSSKVTLGRCPIAGFNNDFLSRIDMK